MKIQVTDLAKSYGKTRIFDGVSFDIHAGEKVIITGPSGCGKTTLLRILAGLENQDNGDIIYTPEEKPSIAWIPQDLGLWPNLSVYQNVAMAYQAREGNMNKKQQVLSALEQCQILNLKKRRPAKLSAGEQQRVALARALVSSPRILLLDEPFASLDLVRRKHFFEILKETWTEDLIVIVVTHDPFDAVGLEADRIMVIEDKELVEDVCFPDNSGDAYASETLRTWTGVLGAVDKLND